MEFVVEALGAIDKTDDVADDGMGEEEAAYPGGAQELPGSPREAEAAKVSTVSPEDAQPPSIGASAAANAAARIEEAGVEAAMSDHQSEEEDVTMGEEGLPPAAASAESDEAVGDPVTTTQLAGMTAGEEEQRAPEAAEVSAEAIAVEMNAVAASPELPEDDPELCRVCRTKGGKKV